jgi:protoporphyrin/coproporphyrin ferrochelatase
VWTPEGSPLLIESRRLTEGLAARMRELCGDSVIVDLAMTYGQPVHPVGARAHA